MKEEIFQFWTSFSTYIISHFLSLSLSLYLFIYKRNISVQIEIKFDEIKFDDRRSSNYEISPSLSFSLLLGIFQLDIILHTPSLYFSLYICLSREIYLCRSDLDDRLDLQIDRSITYTIHTHTQPFTALETSNQKDIGTRFRETCSQRRGSRHC